jgi:uncharacterized membrane protein
MGESTKTYNPAMNDLPATRRWLVLLLALYACARVLQIFPTHVPTLLIVILHVLPPALFALLHGRGLYGNRGILLFTALCLAIGSFFELLSLRTGFPFGHDVFTAVMGPKLFGLPILLSLAWLGLGYISWVLASLIVGAAPRTRTGTFVTPFVAACVMTAWDLAMDPVWSHIDHAWIWRDGGAWFGVPIASFFGWFLTTWLFCQSFALRLRTEPAKTAPAAWNRLAIGVYAIAAAGNLLLAVPSALPGSVPATISDSARRHWHTADAVHASIVVSMLVMLPFALVAWLRAAHNSAENALPPSSVSPKQHRVAA